MGDFNLHVNNSSNVHARQLLSLTESFGLEQHVSDAIHTGGHILDLVLSRSTEKLVTDCTVTDLVSDHFIVRTIVLSYPRRPSPSDI